MKALYCRAFGPETDLTVEEIDSPVPSGGEVLVSVQAAGLNFPDLLCVRGEYQFKPPLPFVPGSEGAGVVTAVGEGVSGVSIDDRVCFSGLSGAFAEEIVIGRHVAQAHERRVSDQLRHVRCDQGALRQGHPRRRWRR